MECVNKLSLEIILKLSAGHSAKWYQHGSQAQKAKNMHVPAFIETFSFELMFVTKLYSHSEDRMLEILD